MSVIGPLWGSFDSQIYKGIGSAFSRPVAIKLFLQNRPNCSPSRAATEYYRALEQLSKISRSDSDFGVARPLAVIEKHGLVIIEWISGSPLNSVLVMSAKPEARAAARKAGLWIGRLQTLTGLERRPMGASVVLQRLRPSIAGIRGRSATRLLAAAWLLWSTAESVAAEPIPWSRHHGDFKPANLIMHEGKLLGIDIDLKPEFSAPAIDDVAHFLNHLYLLYYTVRGFRRIKEIPDLVEAFCEGYTMDAGIELPRAALAWAQLRNALYLRLHHQEWSRPPRSWAARLALGKLVGELAGNLRALTDSGNALAQPHCSGAQPSSLI